MARTKRVCSRIHPSSGVFAQQPLRALATNTDIDRYPLRARSRLLNDILPQWKRGELRVRNMNGLNARIDDYYTLLPAGGKKREVMSSKDARMVRQQRKRVGAGGVEKIRLLQRSLERRRALLRERMALLAGGEGTKKWVSSKRSSRLGVVESCGDENGVGPGTVMESREERSKRLLNVEKSWYGGYVELKGDCGLGG